MRILELLKQLFVFYFFKLLSVWSYPNILDERNAINKQLDESLILLDRVLDSTNPPEFYDFKTTDLDLSLMERAKSSILKENFSPFFTNSLAIEIDTTVKIFSSLQNKFPNDVNELCFNLEYIFLSFYIIWKRK